MRRLFRAGNPPAEHGIAPVYGPIVPLVIPGPCSTANLEQRRLTPCVLLLPPADRLCTDGVVGAGQLAGGRDAPRFALQADRVTLRDTSGALRIDALQGYVRYDDAERGLLLICADVRLLEPVGPNARRFIALCSNAGEEGWAISGQVTDGNGAAPDSVSLTIDGPDGRQIALVGGLTAGSIVVRE
jgi:hypothetical protein